MKLRRKLAVEHSRFANAVYIAHLGRNTRSRYVIIITVYIIFNIFIIIIFIISIILIHLQSIPDRR